MPKGLWGLTHMTEVDRLRDLISEANRIVIFTGAGVSTESGIPDFRSPGGVWDRYKPIYFDDFMSSREARRETWRRKIETDKNEDFSQSEFVSLRTYFSGRMSSRPIQECRWHVQLCVLEKSLLLDVSGHGAEK